MTITTALTSTEYDKLRGTSSVNPSYRAVQYVSLCPNTVIFKALVNGPKAAVAVANLDYDTVTTGAYTDIQIGQTIYISHTDDIRAAHFVGRIRLAPNSSTIYVNETSADIQDNDTIFICHDFRVTERVPRYANSQQFVDYQTSFAQVPPIIYNLDSAYAGIVSGSPSGLTIAFSALAVAGTSGATISSYAYTVPSGGTVTAGSASTANVTIRFDAGFYWLKLVVTDSGARTATRYIPIWSVPADLSSQVELGITSVAINAELGAGYSATLPAFDGIADVLDGTLVCVWDVETYNGTTAPLIGNVKFVGRTRSETNQLDYDENGLLNTSASIPVEGPLQQLARLRAPSVNIVDSPTPTIWGDIKNLTNWRAIAHILSSYTTFLTLHSLQFSDTGDTYRANSLPIGGGSLSDALQSITYIQTANRSIEMSPAGQMYVLSDARYLSDAARDALTVVADWTTADYTFPLTLDITYEETVGRVDANGASYNTTTKDITVVDSLAPGIAFGAGAGTDSLEGQTLLANSSKADAQNELNTRVGHHYASVNPTPTLKVVHPGGYNFLVPSLNQYYTWTLDTTTNDRNISYDTTTRWLLTSVSIEHDNETGTKAVNATYIQETRGVAGQTIIRPAYGDTTLGDFENVDLPPFNALPSFPIEVPEDFLPDNYDPVTDVPPFTGDPMNPPETPEEQAGQEQSQGGDLLLAYSSSQVWIVKNIFSDSPTWQDITPQSGLTIKDAKWDPFGAGVYVLATAASDEWSHDFDFSINDGGWVALDNVSDGNNPATYGSGRWNAVVDDSGNYRTGVLQFTLLASSFITGIEIDISLDFSSSSYVRQQVVAHGAGTYAGAVAAHSQGFPKNADFTGTLVFSSGSVIDVDFENSVYIRWSSAFPGAFARLTAARFTGIGTNPFTGATTTGLAVWYNANAVGGGGWTQGSFVSSAALELLAPHGTAGAISAYSPSGALVQYLTAYGSTDGGTDPVTASPGSVGGFDSHKLAANTLAASSGFAQIATSLGGTYANETNGQTSGAQPILIHVPFSAFGSSSPNSASPPDYLLGSSALVSADCLWKIAGGTKTGITPSAATSVIGPRAGHVSKGNGSYIAALTNGPKLFTSVNAGGAWTDRGTVSGGTAVRVSGTTKVYVACGSTLKVSKDFGATLTDKSAPAALVGIEVYGG